MLTPLCMKCKLIGTHIFSDFVYVYANINPGMLYGIINKRSVMLLREPITCMLPNINPENNINKKFSLIKVIS